MSDCVYYALNQHLRWLRVSPVRVFGVYNQVRFLSGHKWNDDTFAGVVPYMAFQLAKIYDDLTAIVERNPDFDLLAQANTAEKKFMGDMGTSPITPGPGVYCGYFSAHAIFWSHEQMPIGDTWVLSIKFRRLKND